VQILHQVTSLAVLLSLIGMGFDLGLNATLRELSSVFRRPALLLKALLAVNVIVPIAAIVMVSLFPLTPGARGGILIMAVSSVPPMAPRKALKAGGEASYTYGLYTAIVLLAVVLVPVSVALVSRLYGFEIRLGPTAVLLQVLKTVVAPVAAGLVVRRFAPTFAERAAPIVGGVATVLLLLAVVTIVGVVWPVLLGLIGNGTMLAMALVSAMALAAGHLLGGPEPENRGVLATMAATRHPGIAMMIVGASGASGLAEQRVVGAIIAFLLVGMLVAIPYQRWLKGRRRPGAPAGAVPA
jgi:BASS family bile acid:Na+ symporter